MKNKYVTCLKVMALTVVLLSVSHFTVAAPHSLTWDADPLTPGAQDGAGSWIIGGNNWIDSADPGVNLPWATLTGTAGAKEVDLIFGSGNGTAGEIVITGTKGAITSGADNRVFLRSVENLIINNAGSGNYTFSGADLNFDGGKLVMNAVGTTTFNNQIALANISFTQANQTLVFTAGNGVVNGNEEVVFGGFLWSGAISGANSTISKSSTVLLDNARVGKSNNSSINIGDTSMETTGLFITGTGAIYIRGSHNIGNNGNMGQVVLDGGSYLSPAGIVGFNIGAGNNGNGRLIVKNSGTVQMKGGIIAVANGGNAVGVLDLRDGLVANSDRNIVINSTATTGTGSLLVSGGTVNAVGILFGADSANATTQNFTSGSAIFKQTGGVVYVGANGINLGGAVNNLVPSITLSGGTIGATAAWSSTLKMTLASGTTTFKAANADNSLSSNITLGGALSGQGKLAKTGAGTLLLSEVNSYQGGTWVSTGILQTDLVGTLGSGDVFVDSTGTLILGNNVSIGNTANLSFATGATINLDYTGAMTLGSLYSGSIYAGEATYTVAELNAIFGGGFTGNGTITVIPEPSTYFLLIFGFICLLVAGPVLRKTGK